MSTAFFRFYGSLNDFLAPERRQHGFERACPERASVKHVIEALGVPHTEVELILANGEPVDFTYRIQNGDHISVYPAFATLKVVPMVKAGARLQHEPCFIADSHLGALARNLRMLGFDVLYRNSFDDAELARIASRERRIVLSRDRDLLMHKAIEQGCYVHASDPAEQLQEVLARFDLYAAARPFTRCLRCNGLLAPADKHTIADAIPQRSSQHYERYWQCSGCGRVYWEGSHWQRMRSTVAGWLSLAQDMTH